MFLLINVYFWGLKMNNHDKIFLLLLRWSKLTSKSWFYEKSFIFQPCDVISKCAKVIFFGVDFQKGKKKTILDPQNRDDRVDLRVFGEVWAWIDVFMLVSYQYSTFFLTDRQNLTFDKIPYYAHFWIIWLFICFLKWISRKVNKKLSWTPKINTGK